MQAFRIKSCFHPTQSKLAFSKQQLLFGTRTAFKAFFLIESKPALQRPITLRPLQRPSSFQRTQWPLGSFEAFSLEPLDAPADEL